jgi:hypothetical protein
VDDAFDAFVREVVYDDTLSLWRVDEPEYGGGANCVSVVSAHRSPTSAGTPATRP